MSIFAYPRNFPQGTIIDPKGVPNTDGKYLLLSLFNRTGGNDGIVPVVQTGLIAQGAAQTTALLLAGDWNEVDTVAPGTGVQMPSMKPGNDITVLNNGANPLNLYPFGGAGIDGGAINAPISIPVGQLRYLQCWTTTAMRTAYHT
jgi:hypothetical protein